jgi:membrane glycosyltransferase
MDLPASDALTRLHEGTPRSAPAARPADLAAARRRRLDRERDAAAARSAREGQRPQRSFPALVRGPMVAAPWRARPFHGLAQALLGRDAGPQRAPSEAINGAKAAWTAVAARRRSVFMALIALSTLAAVVALWAAWPADEIGALHVVVLVLFAILFGWIAAGFWTAITGFVLLLRGGDRHSLMRNLDRSECIAPSARTAIVMPVCNEDVATVFGGLRATMESLAATGSAQLFDVFVLSDTCQPDLRVQEIAAFNELKAVAANEGAEGESGRLFYRWRGRAAKKKAGNVADFCRRWGRNYRYMVVLDADSVMSGDCLTALVRLMEAHPDAGIIQTAPRALGPDTLHGRLQQFVQRVTGPLFTAGMQYWQMGESHYWGHNAIIRTAPFMQHAALAKLPARNAKPGMLDGDVMSHDFVEAALMRRAGYHVWVAHELQGSYEQVPQSLATELQRDRRWCLGNLQNGRLIGEPGLHPVHRVMLLTGLLSYLSAPLWLGFLLLSMTLALVQHTASPLSALAQVSLQPQAGAGASWIMLALFAATATMLVLPKLLALAAVFLRREQRRFGGSARLLASAAAELVLSVFMAPVRMMFHAQFVLAATIGQFTGWKFTWRSPPRGAQATTWTEALRIHGVHAGIAALWLGSVLWAVGAGGAVWLAPVLVPLLVAIPLSVLTSLPSIGGRLARAGLFAVPEEAWMPAVLRAAQRYQSRPLHPLGFADAVANPAVHAEVSRAMGVRETQEGLRAGRRLQLAERAAQRGLSSLTAEEQMRLLSEPQALALLRLWLAARGTAEARASAATPANGSVWADGQRTGTRGNQPRRAQRRAREE